MELSNMTMEDVLARLKELDDIVKGAKTPEEIDAAAEEKRALLDRQKELKDLEERKKGAEDLGSGKASGKTTEKRGENMEQKEYREAWLRNLMGKEITPEQRAAVTGEAAVIPTETLNKMIVRIQENPLLGKVDLIQIPGYVRIPIYSTNGAASWTATASDSGDAFTYIDLTPYQLIKTINVPSTINEMSIDAFEDYVAKAMGNQIEIALQKAVLTGDGSSKATGIATVCSTVAGTFTKAGMTKKDLLTIMGKLPADYQNGACWIMPAKVFYGEVMNIADHNTFASINAGFDIKLLGHDVVLADEVDATQLTNDTVFYGNPKAYHLNIGSNIKFDKDFSTEFRSNNVVYRAVALADGKLDNAAAFVRYWRSTT